MNRMERRISKCWPTYSIDGLEDVDLDTFEDFDELISSFKMKVSELKRKHPEFSNWRLERDAEEEIAYSSINVDWAIVADRPLNESELNAEKNQEQKREEVLRKQYEELKLRFEGKKAGGSE